MSVDVDHRPVHLRLVNCFTLRKAAIRVVGAQIQIFRRSASKSRFHKPSACRSGWTRSQPAGNVPFTQSWHPLVDTCLQFGSLCTSERSICRHIRLEVGGSCVLQIRNQGGRRYACCVGEIGERFTGTQVLPQRRSGQIQRLGRRSQQVLAERLQRFAVRRNVLGSCLIGVQHGVLGVRISGKYGPTTKSERRDGGDGTSKRLSTEHTLAFEPPPYLLWSCIYGDRYTLTLKSN